MKRFRLLLAALAFGVVTTACSSDLVGPTPTQPSYDEIDGGDDDDTGIPGFGQGGFGSGG